MLEAAVRVKPSADAPIAAAALRTLLDSPNADLQAAVLPLAANAASGPLKADVEKLTTGTPSGIGRRKAPPRPGPGKLVVTSLIGSRQSACEPRHHARD